jgi:penicillin-binding protein 1C
VPLRGELVGVAAGSLQLFGKHASGLDGVEAALLAAMVRAPNAAAPLLARRACALLQGAGMGCTGVEITLAQALARRPGPQHTEADAADAALAPHLARRVLAGFADSAKAPLPARLPSTLDARVQRLARALLAQQLAELRGRGVDDGALLVLDNRSGEVLAWVGSAGRGASAPAVDAVPPGASRAPRSSPSSTAWRWSGG